MMTGEDSPPLDTEPGPRPLPHDPIAEQSVIGSCMMSARALIDVVEHLTPDDFHNPAHETIFAAMLAMQAAGTPVDPITAANHLASTGDLARIGGPAYLHTLVASVPTAANAVHYAGIVTEHAARRRLITAGSRIEQLGWADDAGDAETRAAEADRIIRDTTGGAKETTLCAVGDVADPLVDELFEDTPPADTTSGGILTPWKSLNDLLLPLRPGQLVVIGGRPAMGKSLMTMQILVDAAMEQNAPAILFTLEMTRREVVERALACLATISLTRVRERKLSEHDKQKLGHWWPHLSTAPLHIDDGEHLTIARLDAHLRRHHPRVVGIDYVQLMTGTMSRNGGDRARALALGEISRDLKALAKRHDCTIIAAAQLNRDSVSGSMVRPPRMSDLREAGDFEQDADTVVLIHREDAYERDSPRAGEADFIVEKQRGGPIDTVTVAFQGHYARFANMAI